MIRLLIGQQGMAENVPKVLHILLCREDILPIEEFRYIRVEWMNEVEMMLKVFEKSLLFKCRYLSRCRLLDILRGVESCQTLRLSL